MLLCLINCCFIVVIIIINAGYANEVGESFRALIHVNWVRFSYVVSSSYVCADAASKGSDASKVVCDIFGLFYFINLSDRNYPICFCCFGIT